MSSQWWGAKGSFEARAKQMAKQMLGDSNQNVFKSNTDSDECNQERTPFKNRVETMFAAISKPSATAPAISMPLQDISQNEELSSSWVVADFPDDVSALKRKIQQEQDNVSNGSDAESADDEIVDEENPDPRKQGLNHSIEVLESNPYEQQCVLSARGSGSKGKSEHKVRGSANNASQPGSGELPEMAEKSKAGRHAAGNSRLCFTFSQTGKTS